jgi:hypothetical protein
MLQSAEIVLFRCWKVRANLKRDRRVSPERNVARIAVVELQVHVDPHALIRPDFVRKKLPPRERLVPDVEKFAERRMERIFRALHMDRASSIVSVQPVPALTSLRPADAAL